MVVHLPGSGGGVSGGAEERFFGDGGLFSLVGTGRHHYVRADSANGTPGAGSELCGEYGEGCSSLATGGTAGRSREHDLSRDDRRVDDPDPRRGKQAGDESSGCGCGGREG